MGRQTLQEFLRADARPAAHPDAVSQAILNLGSAAHRVWRRIQDGYPDDLATLSEPMSDGVERTSLDAFADEIFADAARHAGVAFYASAGREQPLAIDASAALALAISPLDGWSNLELDLSFGTIFSILPALPPGTDGTDASFLQSGSRQLSAGFVIYGPRLIFALTTGSGAHVFAHSAASGDYVLLDEGVSIPREAKEFAVNASNYRHWDDGLRAYFDDCVKGVHGPRERDFSMRWLESLVVEAYRILLHGGVYLDPVDRRPGHGAGRLRLVHEANPVAFLVEQAGGSATDGTVPILSIVPSRLDQRTPLVFGSGREVAKLTAYHADAAAIGDRSPLFAHRGLFRS